MWSQLDVFDGNKTFFLSPKKWKKGVKVVPLRTLAAYDLKYYGPIEVILCPPDLWGSRDYLSIWTLEYEKIILWTLFPDFPSYMSDWLQRVRAWKWGILQHLETIVIFIWFGWVFYVKEQAKKFLRILTK